MAVAAGASGWVGLGISNGGAMPGADIVVFEKENLSLTDYYATEFGRPTKDKCQDDWTAFDKTVSPDDDGSSFLAFRATRVLETGDPQDRALTDDSDFTVQATATLLSHGAMTLTCPIMEPIAVVPMCASLPTRMTRNVIRLPT